MKKLVVMGAFIFCAVMGASAQQNDNGLIAKARQAARQYISQNEYQGCLEAQVETTGICFVSGTLKRVNFYYDPTCHCNQEPCPKPAVRIIATVDVDCEGNVIGVTGY